MSQRGVSNVRNMATTEKLAEDSRHVLTVMKRTLVIWRKIALRKLDVQTANNTIQLTQDLVTSIIKKKKY